MNFNNYETYVFDFNRTDEGDRQFCFRLKYQPVNSLYIPFLTNSLDCISIFIDPYEFAETIQDKGAKYRVTSGSIVFEDEASARIAYEYLAEVVADTPQVEGKLYNYARTHYFGQRSKVAADLEALHPDGYGNEEIDAYYAEKELIPHA